VKLDKAKGARFTDFELKTLEMIPSSITIIFENAELYENMTRQATEDGLTGRLNHITFQEKLRKSTEKCNMRDLPVFL
jgi:GAF domain-containing protein